MNIIDRDSRFLARDFPLTNIHVVKTEGSLIYDHSGKQYIDFLTGWCVGNIGWGNAAIRARLQEYHGPEYVNPSLLYEPWVDLAETLAAITPGQLQVCFRATGGTEAVEIALQAAMSYTKRNHFISIEGAYHGHSIGAMSVGSSEFRDWYSNLMPNCHKLKTPLNDRAADQLEILLKNNKIAALIMEPIICNLGVVIPEKSFMQRAAALCKQYGALFIMDEVATGFGRTGKLFASNHYDLEPDIMCLGKGISGGYGALGATIATEAVAKAMNFPFSFYSTYGWHPIAVEAALANLAFIEKNQTQLEKNTNEMSAYFVARLKAMHFPTPFTVHAKGLAIAVEFEKENYALKIATQSRENGVLFSPLDTKMITIYPALNIDKKTAEMGLDNIAASIEG